MGSMVEFSGKGKPFQGYLAPSATGSGPGVIVIQEWWGLVGHIKDVADRFAAEGFTALAPDFYHGEATKEPDEAAELMMAMQMDDAAKVIAGAVEFLKARSDIVGKGLGVVGFCMGGRLSVFAACLAPDIKACANFYGVQRGEGPDYSKLQGPMLGNFAELDEYATPASVANLSEKLTAAGKDHDFKIYPGCQHAFFNDDRPEVYDAAAAGDAWDRTVTFFRKNLS